MTTFGITFYQSNLSTWNKYSITSVQIYVPRILAISNVQYVQYCEARLISVICILSVEENASDLPLYPRCVCGAWPVIQGTNVWISIKIFIIYLPYWYNLIWAMPLNFKNRDGLLAKGMSGYSKRNGWLYTVKKGSRVSRHQPGCHWPNSPSAGIIQLWRHYSRPGRVWSDSPAGDGKLSNLFLRCSERDGWL